MKKLTMEEMQRMSADDFKTSAKADLTIVLDNVRSMMNVGSVFRTADAFRLRRIFLCGITATPPHREIQKTALGATESVEWAYHPDSASLVAQLKQEGSVIIAVEQVDSPVMLNNWIAVAGKSLVLVFGNEVTGVSGEVLRMCDFALEIPQFGTKHSLNIAVSAGIVIWEASRQLRTFEKL